MSPQKPLVSMAGLLAIAALFVACQTNHWLTTIHQPASPQSKQTKTVARSARTSDTTKTSSQDSGEVAINSRESAAKGIPAGDPQLTQLCEKELGRLPGRDHKNVLDQVCQKVTVMPGCQSANGIPIFQYDKVGTDPKGKRIFTMALIHGDEIPAGSVARSWMERLEGLSPRNNWRVVPVANPDGLNLGTRTNSHGVDLNRNFPSSDWSRSAIHHWIVKKKRNPRRYPGPGPASEMETQCFIKQFKDFKPDFIISIHTPLAVLDFDGPKLKFPTFSPLPWFSLGTYPGSLGRYMWEDHNVPVLTIELTPSGGISKLERFDRLQDITGTIAIQANRILKTRHHQRHKHNLNGEVSASN